MEARVLSGREGLDCGVVSFMLTLLLLIAKMGGGSVGVDMTVALGTIMPYVLPIESQSSTSKASGPALARSSDVRSNSANSLPLPSSPFTPRLFLFSTRPHDQTIPPRRRYHRPVCMNVCTSQ